MIGLFGARPGAPCPSYLRSERVLEILMAGGWAMMPILICSAVALAIILERFWSLRQKTVAPPELGEQVRTWARTRKLDPSHIDTLSKNSPLGELLAAALSVRNRPREIIKERIEDAGRHVVYRLERYLNTLGTIALISPLLGLLGTVIGLIRMFLAVPAYILHRYFRSRVSGLVVVMEKEAIALLDELAAQQQPDPNATASGAAVRSVRPGVTA